MLKVAVGESPNKIILPRPGGLEKFQKLKIEFERVKARLVWAESTVLTLWTGNASR